MNLTIERLSVTYQSSDHSQLALDAVSLSLRPGRVTALVGESGSGKTTLGKAAMGLLPDTAEIGGSIRLGDRDLRKASEAELNSLRWSRIAMVFQNGGSVLNPVHRIIDQVAEPLVTRTLLPAAVARDRALSALADMDIAPSVARRYPHEISGGELQRCLLAMALVLDPDVLILDEPTASLDAMCKSLVGSHIAAARRKGRAILLITHDLDFARNTADEAVVLYLGQVMEALPATALFDAPLHPYTLALARSYPGMRTRRDLGGIRGDVFYRITHRHREMNGTVRPHAHIVGNATSHEDGHLPPTGCLFQDRCTQCLPECADKDVPLALEGDRRVRCLRKGIVTMLRLQCVAKRYGGISAVVSTSLSLRAGETVCLIGESGSGKTTLAMIAAGYLQPDHGEAFFEDRNMKEWRRNDYPTLARRIGIIHQYPAQSVSHRLSLFEIVAEPLVVHGDNFDKNTVRQRVFDAFRDVRLPTEPSFIHRYPHEVNMGTLQRLCIARALVSKPSLVVADEPTSSLDPGVQAKVLKMMLDLQIEKGLTLLFVTHDLGLAQKIADRIGVMLAGRMVEFGPAADVLEHSGHPYTRLLIDGGHGRHGCIFPGRSRNDAPGCPFAEHCPHAEDECRSAVPPPVSHHDEHHLVQCRIPLYHADRYV